MSFRDVRNLLESLRTLGFPRLVSMENFREPNFPLVAEVLGWLCKRYDPNVEIPEDVSTEQDRVMFIKAVAKFLAIKAGLKLNPKKLYRADGHAVKELLKLSSLLMKAVNASKDQGSDGVDEPPPDLSSFDLGSKISELKATRMLASEITSRGAALHELLGREVELRGIRAEALEKQLDVDKIEIGVQKGIDIISEDIEKVVSLMDNLGSDEANLESKIEKKSMDLERNSKRLRALESVRPAFMDEYEKLEADLQIQYEVYIERFRNLGYLENQLDELNRSEQDKLEQTEQTLKRMHEKMASEAARDINAEDGAERDALFNANTDSEGSDDEFAVGGGGQAVFNGRIDGGLEDSGDESDSDLLSDDDGDDFFNGGGNDLDDDMMESDDGSLSDDF